MGHWNALSYSDQHGVVLVNSVLRYRIRCIAHKCNSYLMPHAALSLLHPLTADNVAISVVRAVLSADTWPTSLVSHNKTKSVSSLPSRVPASCLLQLVQCG